MSEGSSLTVEYALARREIFVSFWRSVAQSPKFRNAMLFYSAGFSLFTLLLSAIQSRSVTLKDIVVGVASAIGFLVFVSFWVFIRGKTARRTLTVSRDGTSTEIGRLKGQVPWGQIKLITDTPEFVLIARTNGNAFFIPHRAFTGMEDRNRFLTEITAWMDDKNRQETMLQSGERSAHMRFSLWRVAVWKLLATGFLLQIIHLVLLRYHPEISPPVSGLSANLGEVFRSVRRLGHALGAYEWGRKGHYAKNQRSFRWHSSRSSGLGADRLHWVLFLGPDSVSEEDA